MRRPKSELVEQLPINLASSIKLEYRAKNKTVTQSIIFGEEVFVSTRKRPLTQKFSFSEAASNEWWRSFLLGNTIKPENKNGFVTFIDLFSSVGGLSLALTEAAASLGLSSKCLFCADVDKGAIEIYNAHFHPELIHCGDVDHLVNIEKLLDSSVAPTELADVLADTNLKNLTGKVDVVLAGPPCQGHSSLNNLSRHEDPRNRFYLHPIAIGIALCAKAIVVENVPGVKRDSLNTVDRAISLLKQHGYTVTGDVLKAEKLGWPQTRHRYFLVAVRDTEVSSLRELSNSLQRPPMSIEWAIADLLDIKPTDLMSTAPSLTTENQKRIQWLFENDKNHLPDKLRPACHRDKAHTYNTVYGRMYWDKPAGTITTGFSTPGRGRYIHPLRRRTLLPWEAARIQGFPDKYFTSPLIDREIKRTELVRWIGNAVPVPLGYPATICALKGLFDLGHFGLNAIRDIT